MVPMARSRLCVVDGTFELFRAFYGAPGRTSPSEVEVGATVALGRSLRSLQRSTNFTHFAVAFDTTIESFRNQLFDGYKTGEGIDPDLFAQFPLAERMARALGFAVLSMVEFEADDGLASAAAQMIERSDVEEVIIASPDKDLMQCVRPGIRTWDRMRDRFYDAEQVREKMGVSPEFIPDYLALVGDTADGIPGVPRWGARSSATALSRFGHLENIPRRAEDWDIRLRGLASLLEQLRAHEELVLLYRTLATLRSDVPLGITWEEMEYRGPVKVLLEPLGDELGVSFGD